MIPFFGQSILNKANLSGADLRSAKLREAWLKGADLTGADLRNANLKDANLTKAKLTGIKLKDAILDATFDEADLSGVNLEGANLKSASFTDANLTGVNLDTADLSDAYLNRADLSDANLYAANFSNADLNGANFTNARFGFTTLVNTELSNSIGIETIKHDGPSPIDVNTIRNFKGKAPTNFLRGCGLTDQEIEFAKIYDPSLSNEEINMILYKIHDLRASRPVQISPIFISYSHDDSLFVDTLEQKLNENGVRFWRDIHDATAGRLETQVDRAIRHNPTVLLILSENSTGSDWVEHEVRLARKLEKEMERDVLCPIALDESWKTSRWPERILEQVMEYNILDFSKWSTDTEFEKTYNKLIDGLDMFYSK